MKERKMLEKQGKHKGSGEDTKSIIRLLQTSPTIDDFYAKMREVYKDKYPLQSISYFWKEKSRLFRKYGTVTEKPTTTTTTSGSLKDAETYLAEILNEIKVTNSLLQETLALFKRLEDKPKLGG
jgi:hypothetical protein